MRTVRILGMANNLREMPPTPTGTEVWPSNSHRGYVKCLPRIVAEGEWTRWFNLHSRKHMESAYPMTVDWHIQQDGTKPLYMQKFWSDIPGCVEFPRLKIQEHFATAKGPNRYFTCSVCWLVAFAVLEGFERIELWGFMLSNTKPNEAYKFERPCVAYWIQEARNRGVEVSYQTTVEELYNTGQMIPGDPDSYLDPLYGYETKPEPDWDFNQHCFQHELRN